MIRNGVSGTGVGQPPKALGWSQRYLFHCCNATRRCPISSQISPSRCDRDLHLDERSSTEGESGQRLWNLASSAALWISFFFALAVYCARFSREISFQASPIVMGPLVLPKKLLDPVLWNWSRNTVSAQVGNCSGLLHFWDSAVILATHSSFVRFRRLSSSRRLRASSSMVNLWITLSKCPCRRENNDMAPTIGWLLSWIEGSNSKVDIAFNHCVSSSSSWRDEAFDIRQQRACVTSMDVVKPVCLALILYA